MMERVGIIGGGVMGMGIAQLALLHDHPVCVIETAEDGEQQRKVEERILHTLTGYLDKMVAKNLITAEKKKSCLDNLKIEFDLEALSGSNLVIEAVVEDLALKQEVLAEVERRVRSDTLITTNTSTLSITSLARVLQNPERLVGLHFFNPPVLMKLIEVVKGLSTSPQSVKQARDWAERWGKTVVESNSSPGFIVNRIARPYYCESLSVLDEGCISPEVIDTLLVGSGIFPIGVFALIDLIGVDTNYRNTEEMFKAFHYDRRYKPSLIQWEYVQAGRWGRKTGRGFYDYFEKDNPTNEGKGFHQGSSQLPPTDELLKKIKVEVIGRDRILTEIGMGLKKLGAKVEVAKTKKGAELVLSYSGDKAKKAGKEPRAEIIGIIPSDGDLSLLASRHPRVMIDLVIDFDKMTSTAMGGKITDTGKDLLAGVFAALGKQIAFIPPTPGMVVQRVVMTIIDEALRTIGEGIGKEEEIDPAMALGMNWKRQPMELLNLLTPGYVHAVLDNLFTATRSERYRPSVNLLRRSLDG